MFRDGRIDGFGIGGGRRALNISDLRGMNVCFKELEVGGDEDEGRAGAIRRAASTALETAGNIARGILGRLRGRRAVGA